MRLLRSLNAQVVSEGITYQRVARAFVLQKGFVADGVIEAEKESVLRDILSDLGRNLIGHLELTGLALFFGTFFGLVISLFAYDKAGISKNCFESLADYYKQSPRLHCWQS